MGISLLSLQNCWTTCSTNVPISLCCLPTDLWLGFTVQITIQKSQNVHGQLENSVFTHFTFKPLLTGGFGEPTSGCACSRSSILEFVPSRDIPRSYLILSATGGSSSPRSSGSAAHSRPKNSWQFFSVKRLFHTM